MPPARKAAAPPPPLPSYAEAASRTALSLIISEAVDPGGERTRFEAIERSASEALLDVFTRFLRTLGGAARSAAQHAGRSESNIADLLYGLQSVAPDGMALSVPELLAFVEDAPEVAFPVNVSAFPVASQPPSAAATAAAAAATSSDPRPAHVPDFLPPFPEKRTYSRTAVETKRKVDAPAAKKRRAQNRRDAQDSLLKYADRVRGDGAAADGAMPPPPLPALPDEHDDGGAGAVAEALREDDGDGGGLSSGASGAGVAVLRSVPDVLVPSLPALLQSSSRRLETSGLIDLPAFGAPPPQSASDAAAAGGVMGSEAFKMAMQNAPDRQREILKLKHLHGLDGLDEGRQRGRGGAAGGDAGDAFDD